MLTNFPKNEVLVADDAFPLKTFILKDLRAYLERPKYLIIAYI